MAPDFDFNALYKKTGLYCTSNFNGRIEPLLYYSEAKALYNFCKTVSKDKIFVEIGSWKGRSSVMIGTAFRGRLYCIDTWLGGYDNDLIGEASKTDIYFIFLSNINRFGINPSIIRQPSVEASKLFVDKSIDVLFLDADHKYESVKADLIAWIPKVRGWLLAHDYGYCDGVKPAFDEILKVPPIRIVDRLAFFDLREEREKI